jgi:tRNA G26 N,N-dimethylase Trm1
VPRFNVLLEKVRRKGYKASRTHFDPEGIRSDLSYGELVKLL